MIQSIKCSTRVVTDISNVESWLLKTNFGWCGLVTDEDTIKVLILPSVNRALVIKRLKHYGSNEIGTISAPDRSAMSERGLSKGKTLAMRLWFDLSKYFNGEKVDFRCKIDLRDYTNFEKSVYRTLTNVPYGRIRSYGWLAKQIRHSGASRAVGNALAKNPVPLLIPCHRIIKSDGSLGRFSAIGGQALKEKLLRLEKAL
jgi:O-6-methylguanine DNA methyltransferase